MLKIHVWYHKDGDHLVIVEQPWWLDIYVWLVNRICPCHGITGWISRKSEQFEFKIYGIWNKWLGLELKHQKELFRVPIENACVASHAIFKRKDACWRNDCENCWHLQEDAFMYEGGE